MVLVTRLKTRGATITVEANGETLFGPTGPVAGFTRSFSNKARGFVIQAAPANKRPRWGHYGPPLKRTIRATTRLNATRMRAYAAVGSTAPHAVYVDQGTGVYRGHAPYLAKILPPWTRGSPSLYESTWHPAGRGTTGSKPVFIKGQPGQFFFKKGLDDAFAAEGIAFVTMPGLGEGDPIPAELVDAVTRGAAAGAFQASLTEWRAWRDAAFRRGDALGRNGGKRKDFAAARKSQARRYSRPRPSARERRDGAAARSKRYRDRQKEAKSRNKNPTLTRGQEISRQRASFLSAVDKKFGSGNVLRDSLTQRDGYFFIQIRESNPRGGFSFREVKRKIT